MAWLVCTGAGCGDPLVDGNYRGPPAMEIHGNVLVETSELEEELRSVTEGGSLRMGMFWWTEGQPEAQWIEQVTWVETRFPALYIARTYRPPPDQAVQASFRGRAFAVGVPLVYVDGNENGVLDAGEPILGGSVDRALIWSPEGVHLGIALRSKGLFADAERDSETMLPGGFVPMRASVRACGNELTVQAEAQVESPLLDLWAGNMWHWNSARDCLGQQAGPDEWSALLPHAAKDPAIFRR